MMTEKEKKIQKILEAYKGQIKDIIFSLAKTMSTNQSLFTGEEAEELTEEILGAIIDAADIKGLLDLYVPVYEKHFTEDEIDFLVEIHGHPVYLKLLKLTPTMITEFAEIQQLWFGNRLDKMKEAVDRYDEI